MKRKEHRFTIVVKTLGTRNSAELALLSAFALRNPDYCEFHLRKKAPTARSVSRPNAKV